MRKRQDWIFQHRLALALGCTRRELLQRITARELVDWVAYWSIEPFGDDYYAHGIVASTIANVFRSKGRRFRPEDFKPRPRHSQQQMKAIFQAVAQVWQNKP